VERRCLYSGCLRTELGLRGLRVLRNKPEAGTNAHLVGDFSYRELVTTVGLFTPKGHCVEIAQAAHLGRSIAGVMAAFGGCGIGRPS
jgi:hypothetical protein